MNANEQITAIAKACGWKYQWDGGDREYWYDKGGKRIQDFNPNNVLNDLNAMHEVEKTLSIKCEEYLSTLDALTYTHFDYVTATAAQRAEAFLKTLNLWTE
jgi:hypothetical protein